MECQRCGEQIEAGEEMECYGQIICEDCYIRALSPARACDPWAVRSAQMLAQQSDGQEALTERQTAILRALVEVIANMVGLNMFEFQREFATLRHMEKARGEMRGSRKVVRLW